jgi:NADPH:quinone reductase-like Zn-dependent oxidoreductase
MATMKAVRIHQYGGPEMLRYEDAPRPEPAAGEVLVRVRAAGVNPVDWKIRQGYFKDYMKHNMPLILGWDVSGVVEATGTGVARWKRGDEVYGRADLARDGSYAEYIVVRENEIARKPKSLDHVHAATVPLAGLTAWQSLLDIAALARGQTVLIHAAAGGVGHLAVQLAKWRGARVVGTASARNAAFVRELGAEQVIDHNAGRFEDALREVDVVLDTIGGEVQQRSWKTLKPGGILVSLVSPPSEEEAAKHRARGLLAFIQSNASQLADMAGLIEAGKLRPVVETVMPLADARRAHDAVQGGHTRGKIVLSVP